VNADLIVMLAAIVESKGYNAKIRVGVFDAIWARYDSGDPGSGKVGHVCDDVADNRNVEARSRCLVGRGELTALDEGRPCS
jgi:hypothetical protein